MRKLRKVMALLLTLAMVMGMSLTTFAMEVTVAEPKKDIKITGLSENALTTLKLVQFISLQRTEETNSYEWVVADWAQRYVSFDEANNEYVVDSSQYDAFYKVAQDQAAYKTYTETEENGGLTSTEYTFEQVNIGAYVVIASDSKAEYNIMIANTYDTVEDGSIIGKDVEINAKAQSHDLTKEADDNFAHRGDTVTFTISTVFPAYTTIKDGQEIQLSKFVITDTPVGLDILEDQVQVMLGGTDVTSQVSIEEIESNGATSTLTIDFASLLNNEENAGKTVTVTYKAIVVDEQYNNTVSADSNTVDYDDGNTSGNSGSIQITKVDEEDTNVTLKGAEFKVYYLGENEVWDPASKGNPLKFVTDDALPEDGIAEYTQAVEGENGATDTLVATDGKLKIKGLEEGYYHFEEVKAPNGYSVNSDGLTVQVVNNNPALVEADFLDTKLAELPGTGGIGTTIFTIGGCVIMIAAAGLYFASRRKHGEN